VRTPFPSNITKDQSASVKHCPSDVTMKDSAQQGTTSYGACPASGQAQDKMRCDSRSGCSTPPMAAAIWCSELN